MERLTVFPLSAPTIRDAELLFIQNRKETAREITVPFDSFVVFSSDGSCKQYSGSSKLTVPAKGIAMLYINR